MVEIGLGAALAAIGAGVAIGFAGLGSGLGQGMAAAGSVGAVAEDNDMFARGIIFSALPETQAIYGFLVAILLLVFSGLLGGNATKLTLEAGIIAIGVGASIGFAGLGSGMGQGMAAASSVGAIVEDNDMFARGIIFSALPETQAIYGFLIAILLMVFGGILAIHMSSGTSKIVESIMSVAQEKADGIIQDANAEVSQINANAEKTAEAEKTKILENGKKQSDMRYQQIISEAKMNARRAELGAKEDVIEAAFNQAIGELKIKASSGDEEYKDSLSKMIMEATNEIGSNDLILQLNEADTQKFKDDLSSQGSDSFEIEGIKFTLGEPIDAIGGAILKTANGDIEVNNTIEARLERFKSILRSEVAEILFK